MEFRKEKEKKKKKEKPAPAPFQPRRPKRPIQLPAPAHFFLSPFSFSPRR
jgi:hypothetical protein